MIYSNEEKIDAGLTTAPLFQTLSNDQQQQVLRLAQQLQLGNYESILQFGKDTQQQLANLSNKMFLYAKQKETAKIYDLLNQLMGKLTQIDPHHLTQQKQNFFSRLFKKTPTSIQQTITQLKRIAVQIDRLAIQLDYSLKQLLQDILLLEELYIANETYAETILLSIAALEMKKQHVSSTMLAQSIDLTHHENKEKLADDLLSLDQRLYDLQLSRQLALQTGPQIRMMQQTHKQLAEKMQMSILSTIPLWKNQLSVLLTLHQQHKTATMQHQLTSATKEFVDKKTSLAQVTRHATEQTQQQTNTNVEALLQTQKKLLLMIEETLQLQETSE